MTKKASKYIIPEAIAENMNAYDRQDKLVLNIADDDQIIEIIPQEEQECIKDPHEKILRYLKCGQHEKILRSLKSGDGSIFKSSCMIVNKSHKGDSSIIEISTDAIPSFIKMLIDFYESNSY